MNHFLKEDVVFKIFFTRYVEHLASIINELLNINVSPKDITIINNDLFGRSPKDKHCILDLAVEVNNETIIIEMQNLFNDNLYNRFDYYICLTYANQLKTKDSYDRIDKVIGIFFINQDSKLFPNLFAKCVNYDILNKQELPETRVEYFINLTKIEDSHKYGFSESLIKYLKLISCDNEKELIALALTDEKIEKALEALKEINADEELSHYLALKSANDIYNNTMANQARDKGHREGLEQGLQEGTRQGLQQGIEQGSKNKSLDVTKKLLQQNVDINIISLSTGLSLEEIKKLQYEL